MKRSYGPRELNLVPKFNEALIELGEATVSEVCAWMDVNYPRKDGRTWQQDMVLLGDYAIYPNGNPVNKTPTKSKFFMKTTQPETEPAKFKLLNGDDVKWSEKRALDKENIKEAPDAAGIYRITQATDYDRYNGKTNILEIGMSKKNLRNELENHLSRHTTANRLAGIRNKHPVFFECSRVNNPKVWEDCLLRDFEDKYWDLPVLNSNRGYDRNEDIHYRQRD
jgi:hypothetical protein